VQQHRQGFRPPRDAISSSLSKATNSVSSSTTGAGAGLFAAGRPSGLAGRLVPRTASSASLATGWAVAIATCKNAWRLREKEQDSARERNSGEARRRRVLSP
jgi:L-aminopeptidase/D-esterase-like protein